MRVGPAVRLPYVFPNADLDLNEFPAVKAWMEKIVARPASRKGLDVPSKNSFLD